MKWIFDHFQLVVAIAGAIAYWLSQRKTAAQERPSDADPQMHPMAEQAEEAQRARRIQEEIRRKIAERRGVPASPQPVARPAAPVVVARHAPEEDPVYDAGKWMDPAVLERQRALAEQMAELQARQAAASREAQTIRATVAEPAAAAKPAGELSLMQSLRNARSLRKAIILREILGSPVALR